MDSTTPKPGRHTHLSSEGGTPPASGATTPTATSTVTDAAKSVRPFLGLSTLTDLIRLRYPSTHQPRSVSSDGPERTLVTETDKGTQNGGDKAQDSSAAVGGEVQKSSLGAEEEREITEDKLSLTLRATTALVSSMQGD